MELTNSNPQDRFDDVNNDTISDSQINQINKSEANTCTVLLIIITIIPALRRWLTREPVHLKLICLVLFAEYIFHRWGWGDIVLPHRRDRTTRRASALAR